MGSSPRKLQLIGLLAILALSPAWATDPFNLDGLRVLFAKQQEALQVRQADPVLGHATNAAGVSLPIYSVGLPDLVGEPGQSVRQLLTTRGQPLRERTRETQWEVCARICVSPEGRYGIRPATLRASLVCATSPSICPPGFIATDESVHTHGAGPVVMPTPVDLILDPSATMTHVRPNELSPEDLAVPGTWLLAPNGDVVSETDRAFSRMPIGSCPAAASAGRTGSAIPPVVGLLAWLGCPPRSGD